MTHTPTLECKDWMCLTCRTAHAASEVHADATMRDPFGRLLRHDGQFGWEEVGGAPKAIDQPDPDLLARAMRSGREALAQGFGLKHTGHADCPVPACRNDRQCSPRRVQQVKATAEARRRQASDEGLVEQAVRAEQMGVTGYARLVAAESWRFGRIG
jgi:hypothetical protein